MLALDTLRSNCGITETDTQQAVGDKLRSRLREVGMDPGEDGAVLLRLLEIRDADAFPAATHPDSFKRRVFDVLRQLCLKTSLVQPLVLVNEDLHWVDRLSEEFLAFLAGNIHDARILLLSTYRPGYRSPWMDKSFASQISLQPLSQEDSLQIVRSVLRADPLIDPVAAALVAKADGNPLFLEQLALHAGEARHLRSVGLVPNTIHDVVMARIDRLSDRAKQLLQVASVIGREFPLRLLQAVMQRDSIEEELHELSRLEFVYERVEADGSIYAFGHALTQEIAYGSLLERDRRVHHAMVGRALEELYEARAEQVAELLAFHFGHSGEAEKAIDWAIAAGEKSQRRWANNDALMYFEDALHRLDPLRDSEANRIRRIDAVLKQAEVRFVLGHHSGYADTLDQIRALVEDSGDRRRLATWHYWRGFLDILTGGRPDVASDHCNRAASLAAEAGLDEVKAFSESCLSQIYLIAGRLREAIALGDRALASFEERGDLWWAGRTIAHLSPAAIALGDWEASFAYCRRVLDYGTRLQDLRLRVVGLWRIGGTFIQQGDAEQGLRYCDEAQALGPLPYDATMVKAMRGYGKVKLGRLDEGIANLAEAVAWFEQSRLRYGRSRFALWLAEAHLRRGERATARGLAANALETAQTMGYRQFEGLASWLLSECLGWDAPAMAENHVRTAIEILEEIGARNDLARAMTTRAALRQIMGDAPAAYRLLDEAAKIFRALGTRDEPARVAAARAALDRGEVPNLLAARR
jgi:tetratricopeptide (TPR) repeat protein